MSNSRIRVAVSRLEAYVPGEQPRDPGIVKLNTNENPYPPSPAVAQALTTMSAATLRRYPDPVCLALRERLGAMYGFDPAQVFIGNGSDEVLSLCTRAFVEDGGTIGYFEPSYSLYPVLADARGARRGPVRLGPGFSWTPPPDASALFFLACPNAPTSNAFALEAIRRFALDYRGVLVVDEAYAEFGSQDCLALARELPNVLVMRTLSKSYSLAGVRLGYALGPRDLVEALFKIKDSYNINALTQAVALAALQDQAHMLENVRRIRATRERLAQALSATFEVTASETNFLWVRPRRRPATQVFDALKARRIYVRYFPGALTGDFLRITVGTDDEADALLAALRDMTMMVEESA